MARVVKLKTVVFVGSAKTAIPPWGGDARAGDRVVKWVQSVLGERESKFGEGDSSQVLSHDVTVFDPIQVFGSDGPLASSGAQLSAPHFFLGDSAPEAMNKMRDVINQADCYLIVTPEYNHSLPPALSSMMGHFGGSNYTCKPSAVVSYSPGPWGGARVQVALRPFLAELGCLPVSKMCCIPAPQELFQPDGVPVDASHRMLKQLPQMLTQLEWMAIAMKNQKDLVGLP